MDIKISRNHFKTLSKFFIHLHPIKRGDIKEGGKYNLVSDKYEVLGQVECVKVTNTMLYQLSPVTVLLSEGMTMEDYKSEMMADQCKLMEPIQCLVLRFIRRYDHRFKELIDHEAANSGIELLKQARIF